MASQGTVNVEARGLIVWTPEKWAWCTTLVFLFLRYFTLISSVVLYFSYTAFMLFFALLSLSRGNDAIKIENSRLNGALLCLSFSVLIIIAVSPYSKEELVKFCLLLIDAYILIGVMGAKEFEKATKVFYWACNVVVLITFAVYFVKPSFFSSIEGSYQGLFYSPVFFGVPDNNDTAVGELTEPILMCCLTIRELLMTCLL